MGAALTACALYGNAHAQTTPTLHVWPSGGDDHPTFTQVEKFINDNPTGATVIIHEGSYTVGSQPAGQSGDDVLNLQNCNNVTIEGQGDVVIKFADNLRFGRASGAGSSGPKIGPGVFIWLNKCDNVNISNLNVDGNSSHFDFMGDPNNAGLEIDADAVVAFDSYDVTLSKFHAQNMGRDGVMAKFTDGTYVQGQKNLRPLNLVMMDCSFLFCGRDGFSWVGGAGVRATNCLFNDAGQGVIKAGQKNGIDIEPEGGNWLWDGVFENCEFQRSLGVAVLANATYVPQGQAHDLTFRNCTIGGTENVVATWIQHPGFLFEDCTIHGGLLHAYDASVSAPVQDLTTYRRCTVDDLTGPDNQPSHSSGILVHLPNGTGRRALFDNTTFTIHSYQWFFWRVHLDSAPPAEYATFRDCRFVSAYTQQLSPTVQGDNSIARGAYFEGDTRFVDATNFGPRLSRAQQQTYIETPIMRVAPTRVRGNLTLGGGPDVRYMVATDAGYGGTLAVEPGATLTIDDRNEIINYDSQVSVASTASLIVNNGGMLSSNGGSFQVDGTVLVRNGGYICLDWGNPVSFGTNGRLIYEPGAIQAYDALRYPSGKNCQGTPLLSVSVIARVNMIAKGKEVKFEASSPFSGPFTYDWEIDWMDGQGFRPTGHTGSSLYVSIKPTQKVRVRLSLTRGHVTAQALGYVDASSYITTTQAYPNPADGQLVVQTGVPMEATKAESLATSCQVALYNSRGIQVYQGQLRTASQPIDTRHLPEGIYHLRTTSNGHTTTQQIVIRH